MQQAPLVLLPRSVLRLLHHSVLGLQVEHSSSLPPPFPYMSEAGLEEQLVLPRGQVLQQR